MNRTAIILIASAAAGATAQNIDFSVDAANNALINGQVITGSEFSPLFTLSSTGGNAGLAIFDTTAGGVNQNIGDNDLLVNLGNALILQSNNGSNESQSSPGFFDQANDDQNGGEIIFSFLMPTELASVTLIDMDAGNGGTVTLVDSNGDVRVFDVPAGWTNDVQADGPIGFGTIDFANLGAQSADNPGNDVTVTQNDAGFDLTDVVSMTVDFVGSGGLDNLVIVPAPGSVALLAAGLGLAARRRRA